MDLIQTLRAAGGIARAADLRRSRVSERTIRHALAESRVIRPRRGWIAVADLDPTIRAAAEVGVVVSCISEAARLGLWVTATPAMTHVGADPHSRLLRPTDAIVHWNTPLIVRRPGAFTDPIENVLALVAECEPWEDAVATWESAVTAGLVTPEAMARYSLSVRAREVLAAVAPLADSGLETKVILRLRWMKLPMRRQAPVLGHRVDILVADRLVLQIDGGHHVDRQRDSDIAHDAELALNGYHVIRMSWRQVMDDWATTEDRIVRAVAQGLHLAR